MLPPEVEELYRRFGYAVQRRCRRLLNSQAAADDALQEVFVRVLRYGASFDGEQPLGWLYRMADNVCFDRLGSERREREKRGDLAGIEGSHYANETSADQQRLLAEVLARSEPSERHAALLYYFDGMTHAEIARRLGCSREAVTHRLQRFHDEARRLLSRGESSWLGEKKVRSTS